MPNPPVPARDLQGGTGSANLSYRPLVMGAGIVCPTRGIRRGHSITPVPGCQLSGIVGILNTRWY